MKNSLFGDSRKLEKALLQRQVQKRIVECGFDQSVVRSFIERNVERVLSFFAVRLVTVSFVPFTSGIFLRVV